MELQYIVGRLNFRKETIKILGAFPTEGAAREYAEFRGNGLALNSVLFVAAPDKEAMYLSDEKGTPWKSFDRCRVYDCSADREEMLSDICWHTADELIRRDACAESQAREKEQKKSRKMSKFISVRERRPDIGVPVLTYSPDCGVTINKLLHFSWLYGRKGVPTHWLPLPELEPDGSLDAETATEIGSLDEEALLWLPGLLADLANRQQEPAQNGCVLQAPQTEAPVPEPQEPDNEMEM